MLTTSLTAAATFAACHALRRELGEAPPREGTWVRLRPMANRGAAFGLPVDPKALPVLSAASMALILSRRREHPIGVGLLLGGGLSNLWERVDRGEVRDYLQFPRAPGKLKRYVFNLADLAIAAGAVTLLPGGRRNRPSL